MWGLRGGGKESHVAGEGRGGACVGWGEWVGEMNVWGGGEGGWGEPCGAGGGGVGEEHVWAGGSGWGR